MATKPRIYVEVLQTSNGQLKTTLPTRALLFLITYSGPDCFQVNLVQTESQTAHQFCIDLPLKSLTHFHPVIVPLSETPQVVQKCHLPVVYDEEQAMVCSGLCTSVRRIIEVADAQDSSKNLKEVLGFRYGSLRMSSEVSGWTKICEVELPDSLTAFFTKIQSPDSQKNSTVELPTDLVRMESHFHKPPRIHNDDKLKRAALKEWRTLVADPATVSQVLQQSCSLPSGDLQMWLNVPLHHSTRIFQMVISADDLKEFAVILTAEGCGDGLVKDCHTEAKGQGDGSAVQLETKLSHLHLKRDLNSSMSDSSTSCASILPDSQGAAMNKQHLCNSKPDKSNPQSSIAIAGDHIVTVAGGDGVGARGRPDLKALLDKKTYVDVKLMHIYLEGLEMTVADLVLFVYMYHFIEAVGFDLPGLRGHLPSLLAWVGRLVGLDKVRAAGNLCCLDMTRLAQAVKALGSAGHGDGSGVEDLGSSPQQACPSGYILPPLEDVTQDEMELSRRCRSKYRAIKPQVQQALHKIETGHVSPQVGSHPRGSGVQLDWDSIPRDAHPQSGGVPDERTRRKCQQLENLATAVQAIARLGDVIVDFCSGGGHLGILIAKILPECEVYLVENKEESLLMAKSRIDKLKMKNITMIQCNLEYFHGKFDIGVCLHACGVATDMVLQKCLDSRARFVICPCCYGKVQMTHLISYPQSQVFKQAGITYKDFLTLGHAADQTEFNIALAGQGRLCMNLVDTDRAELAREQGYSVTLCSLQPLTCTPKNNLLVGTR